MNFLIALFAATLYTVEPVNGTVSFNIMKWGVIREEGTFRDFRAQIQFDDQNPAKSSVAFEVDVASVDTKNHNRDGTLKSEDFFHAARYPKMTFRSVQVAPNGKNAAAVTGDLTIHGVTKRITVPVRLLGRGRQGTNGPLVAGFETEFKIDRRAFGITGGRWVAGGPPGILGTEVTIKIVAGGVAR
jgi:polyisoprenoid-binding protein YceI